LRWKLSPVLISPFPPFNPHSPPLFPTSSIPCFLWGYARHRPQPQPLEKISFSPVVVREIEWLFPLMSRHHQTAARKWSQFLLSVVAACFAFSYAPWTPQALHYFPTTARDLKQGKTGMRFSLCAPPPPRLPLFFPPFPFDLSHPPPSRIAKLKGVDHRVAYKNAVCSSNRCPSSVTSAFPALFIERKLVAYPLSPNAATDLKQVVQIRFPDKGS